MYFGCQCSSARCSRLLLGEVDVVRISAEIMSLRLRRFQSNSGLPCSPYTLSAPFSPTAFGRWKDPVLPLSRPKIFVSIVSGPASAGGFEAGHRVGRERARCFDRLSHFVVQSISIGAKVTSPPLRPPRR